MWMTKERLFEIMNILEHNVTLCDHLAYELIEEIEALWKVREENNKDEDNG